MYLPKSVTCLGMIQLLIPLNAVFIIVHSTMDENIKAFEQELKATFGLEDGCFENRNAPTQGALSARVLLPHT